MSKRAKLTQGAVKPARKEWPLVVYVWIGGLGFTSYIVAGIAFNGQPHPLHWASGLVGAIIGGFAGWLCYRWRGDIV